MNAALKKSIDEILKLAFKEDSTKKDITSSLLLTNTRISAVIKFKEKGILCGKNLINYIFSKFDKKIIIKWTKNEGEEISKNEIVCKIFGPGNSIVSIERIILNFLQRLSGIASHTNKFVKIIENKKIKILDTRKTIPGWRALEKYAVKTGGGTNHRNSLSDAILVKDTHIKINGSVSLVMEKLIKKRAAKEIEIEVSNVKELKEAIKFSPGTIMLDNFLLKEIKKCIKIIRTSSKSKIEISGNIDESRLRKMKNYDIDYVSIGKITHSARFLDISMTILKKD